MVISVIIATYNRALTLPRAIDSVVCQIYDNWELIIIDDGSSDSTGDVVERYNDPRISYHKLNTNRGVAAARNAGLDLASGQWFEFLDSDDELPPDALQNLITLATQLQVDAVWGNCLDVQTGTMSGNLDRDQYFSVEDYVRHMRGDHHGITSLSLLHTHRFNEHLFGLESVFWTKLLSGATLFYTHRVVYIYHTEGSDRITSLMPKTRAEEFRIWTSYLILQQDRNYLEYVRNIGGFRYQENIYNIVMANINTGRLLPAIQLAAYNHQYISLKRMTIICARILLGYRAWRAIKIARFHWRKISHR